MLSNLALKPSAEPSATVQTVQAGKKPISIEGLLHWAYRAECVYELAGAFDWAMDGAPGMGRGNSESCLAIGMMGGRVDGGPAMWAMPERVADDALAVHATVLSLGRKRSGPVIVHARAGTRPELDDGPIVTLERIWKDSGCGRSEWRTEYSADYRGGKVGWLCPLRLVDRAEEVAASRAAWRSWCDSLSLLAGHFRSAPQELTRWKVADSLPSAAPWEGAEVKGT